MAALNQGATSSPTNPVLPYVYIEPRVAADPLDDAGHLADVESLTYRVVRVDGTEHTALTAVNLTDSPGGARTSIGTYVPTIVIDGADPVGDYTIEWVAQRLLADTFTLSQTTTFRVVASDETIPNGYALTSDMLAEGLPPKWCSDTPRLVSAIEEASRFIERVTRRYFEPRFVTSDYDGRGQGVLIQVDDPIIGVEDVAITFSDFRPLVRLLDRTELRVYNRHMRGLVEPDDRDNPKVEVLRVNSISPQHSSFPPLSRRFTSAQQNVQIKGWFGYTHPDGSPLGVTPGAITRATMMIAMRNIRPLWDDFSGGLSGGTSGPLQQEHTRSQRATFAQGKNAGSLAAGSLTGDPHIDNILVQFMGPLQLAAG